MGLGERVKEDRRPGLVHMGGSGEDLSFYFEFGESLWRYRSPTDPGMGMEAERSLGDQ